MRTDAPWNEYPEIELKKCQRDQVVVFFTLFLLDFLTCEILFFLSVQAKPDEKTLAKYKAGKVGTRVNFLECLFVNLCVQCVWCF